MTLLARVNYCQLQRDAANGMVTAFNYGLMGIVSLIDWARCFFQGLGFGMVSLIGFNSFVLPTDTIIAP
jgi:hypothetical protein